MKNTHLAVCITFSWYKRTKSKRNTENSFLKENIFRCATSSVRHANWKETDTQNLCDVGNWPGLTNQCPTCMQCGMDALFLWCSDWLRGAILSRWDSLFGDRKAIQLKKGTYQYNLHCNFLMHARKDKLSGMDFAVTT